MDLQSLTLFDMANRKMDWIAQRQSILAENIANSNTPNYMPSDVVEVDFSKELAKANSKNIPLMVTNEKHIAASGNSNVGTIKTDPRHLSGTLANRGNNRVEEIRRPYETTMDKNGVDLEEQMVKVGKNSHEYEVSTTIYNKYTSMLRTSLGRDR